MQKHPNGAPVPEEMSLIPLSGELSPIPPSEHPSHEANNKDQDTRNAASAPGWQAEEEESDSPNANEYDYAKGAPSHFMVVDTLRQFTTLVNTIPAMEASIAESRCILERTKSLLEKATPAARELTVTREYLETFLLTKMKNKRELWDGTGKMEKQARKLRMEWLRAERDAENKERWRKANELNKEHGLPEEPFAAFVSESDEEVIESLQTTPTNSRSGGSSNSAREESNDVGH